MPEQVAAATFAGPTRRHRLASLWSAVGDVGAILALVYMVPLTILAVGTPIALAVRLITWIARGF
jgi:hypothetical protein